MDREILEALKETNGYLSRLSILLSIACAVWLIKNIIVIVNHGKSMLHRSWREKALRLYEDGKLGKLLQQSKDMIQMMPNNPEGYYWKAQVLRDRDNQEEEVCASLRRLLVLAPEWREKWMEKYLSPGSETPVKPGQPDGSNSASQTA